MSDEVDPVTWAIIDAKLRHTFADRLDVAGVAKREAIYPDLDPCPGSAVPQIAEPYRKHLGLADCNHKYLHVSYGRQIVKPPRSYQRVTPSLAGDGARSQVYPSRTARYPVDLGRQGAMRPV